MYLRAVPRRQPPTPSQRWNVPARLPGRHRDRRRGGDLFDYRGYGRAYPVGQRQIVVNVTHLSEDERYRWLDDSLSVAVGDEQRSPGRAHSGKRIFMYVARMLWSASGVRAGTKGFGSSRYRGPITRSLEGTGVKAPSMHSGEQIPPITRPTHSPVFAGPAGRAHSAPTLWPGTDDGDAPVEVGTRELLSDGRHVRPLP